MKQLLSLKKWLLSQFKTHPRRNILIVSGFTCVVVIIGLVFSGILDFGGLNLDQSGFDYLPDREYVLGTKEEEEPQTLQELLYSSSPDIEDFLQNPDIAAELLAAESLTDIVDSRYALNNLREIGSQLEKRTAESNLPMGDLVSLHSVPIQPPVREKTPGPEDALKAFMPEPAPVEERAPLPQSEGAKRLAQAADSIDFNRPAGADEARKSYEAQQDLYSRLDAKVSHLMRKAEYGDWELMHSSINMKVVWQNPGESLIHMIPEADWLPEEGYRVYRQIGEEKELIKEQLAAAQTVFSPDFKHPQAEDIREAYQAAEYTEEDREALGMDEANFQNTVYRTRSTLEPLVYVKGEGDFLRMKQEQITIPDGVEEKMPQEDRQLRSPVQIMNFPENGRYEAGEIRSRVWEKYSVRQSELPNGLQSLEDPDAEEEGAPYTAAATTVEARQQISTLALVDEKFAQEAGFLIRDDLSGKQLSKGEEIVYTIEAPGGQYASVKVRWGEELPLTRPEGFMGYGLDGKVFLRWREPADDGEASIVSGYFIERKLEGEADFVQINEKPVVITEVLDETGIFFETPVMYQEELENGTNAQYRMYSIDVFGRRSEYSDPINIRVEKVTPPESPSTASLVLSGADAPEISDDVLGRAIQKSISENRGKRGIVVPIFNESPDTVRFTLYRAEAEGVGSYSKPVALANFRFENPKKEEGKEGVLPNSEEDQSTNEMPQGLSNAGFEAPHYNYGKLYGARHLFLENNKPMAPDMIYFDADIKQGVTYKYWVSAWDSWDNESAWSKSSAMGVPSDKEPKVPEKLTISMLARNLPAFSSLQPGIVYDENVSQKDVEENPETPNRLTAENTSLVEMADTAGIRIGDSLGKEGMPMILSRYFDNLPEQKYIHTFLGVRGGDVLPDGSARLRWPAYSGDNLEGYAVYQLHTDSLSLENVTTLDREALMGLGQWTKLTEKALDQNQYLIQGLEPKGQDHLFLICLEPATEEGTEEETADMEKTEEVREGADGMSGIGGLPGRAAGLLGAMGVDADGITMGILDTIRGLPINQDPEGGFVLLEWEAPQDLQVKHYRIYRSEVKNFKKEADASKLEWTLVGDLISGTQYTDPVEQSHAHYYYYKITAVSPWGVEASVGTVEKFRVPSTKPPQTPSLLLPLSSKDGIRVNFSAVEYCSRYEVYRAEVPKITIKKLKQVDDSILKHIFATPSEDDNFLTNMLVSGTNSVQADSGGASNVLQSFKTVNLSSPDSLSQGLSQLDIVQRQDAYSKIIHELGPLAVSEYRDLSVQMMGLVEWKKIGELPVDEDTVEQVDSATGLKKPLFITDHDAKYGTHYLYTVQAWNDDELGSTRPEPVEATPRRNRGFDPIDGLDFTISGGEFPSINLSWNEPHMDGLTQEQCLEDTVGYIVYYSTEKDGTYVQASPLVFYPSWSDREADRAATNWYKVRVLDTGGYLSDFSEPILAREKVTVELPKTEIPEEETIQEESSQEETTQETTTQEETAQEETTTTAPPTTAPPTTAPPTTAPSITAPSIKETIPRVTAKAPQLSMDPLYYRVEQGNELKVPFAVSGTEPISFQVSVSNANGPLEREVTVLKETREVLIPKTMPKDKYEVTLTALNNVGRAEVKFTLDVVMPHPTAPETRGEPPVLAFDSNLVNLFYGSGGTIPFTVKGSEPISYRVVLMESTGRPVTDMITVDSQSKQLIVSENLPYGGYEVSLEAYNDYGTDRKSIKLWIQNPPAPSQPPIRVAGGELISFSVEPECFSWGSSLARAKHFALQPFRWDISTPRPIVQRPDLESGSALTNTYKSASGIFAKYTLKNIVLEKSNSLIANVGYRGSADLVFGEPGTGQVLPVRIVNAFFEERDGETFFSDAVIYVDKPYKLEEIGVTISSLNIARNGMGKVSGYVQNADPSKNLIGNLAGFAFTDGTIWATNKIYITAKERQRSVLPKIRLDRLMIDRVSSLEISLDANKDSENVLSFKTEATLKAPLETLNNEGIRMVSSNLSCDAHGRITGKLETSSEARGEEEQFLQLLVPGGAGLKVCASLVYKNGVPTDEGFIYGRIILPFEQAAYTGGGVPGNYASSHSLLSSMDYMMDPKYDKEQHGDMTMNEFFIKFGQTVQKNGLLIVPADAEMQRNCAFAKFNVNNWKGEGFLVENANLTPVRIAERSLKMDDQRNQGIIVSPTEISIDLDREGFIPAPAETQTPQETQKPFWVGMVLKGGNLELPPAFVRTESGKSIEFKLAEGEMIYDLNGFNYQTFLYNEEGVPASFGEQLGGFKKVNVKNCLLDMYANKVNLEIDAEVALELFNDKWVNVKLYTNKEDNEDGKGGEFLCSVAPTVIEDFVGQGTSLTIDGGFLKPEGMKIGGSMELETPEIQLKEPMKFTNMVIPAKKTDTYADNNTDKRHAWATLDKAAPVHMEGFSLDIREINFEYLSKDAVSGTPTRLSFWGSVLLSEDIPIGSKTTDRIALDTLKNSEPALPAVVYDKSFAMLDTSFDDCLDVKGVLVPKRLEGGGALGEAEEKLSQIEQGLIEFETDNLDLGFLGSLGALPVDTITRFGYDVDNSRCYFSIGIVKGEKELDVGIGSMDKFTGLVANNMVVQREEKNHLVLPGGKEEMKNFIAAMEVDRSPEGRFAAAMKGTLNIKDIAQVRDLYFGFENGPMVEASGGLYLPLDVEMILNPNSDGFRHVGDVDILYSHPDRYFSFNMTLNEIDMLSIKLSGSLGFEFSPKLFGVSIGYPETLVGNIHIYHVGLGLRFRLDEDGANIIRAKVEFGFEKSINVFIVYLRGYIYAGADGGYYAQYDENGDNVPDGPKFILVLYLKGGLEGGIKVAGRRFNIIHMSLDAKGSLETIPPDNDWKLACSVKVSYSHRVFLFKISGSVNVKFDTTL